ncbi:MAG: GWxTD domain-containing protein [Candidatus Electryoneaceae bacterium]|nr:GWxTD domain-containing protein [Candidatus Electryoneaceae bacterium]
MSMRYLMVNIIFFIIIVLLGLGISPNTVLGEENPVYWRQDSDIGQPMFVIQPIVRFSDQFGLRRLDIYAEVMNDLLQFVRNENEYTASIELHLSISSANEGQIVRRIQYVTKSVDAYEQTNSRQETVIGRFSVDLPPEDYLIKVVLVDGESHQRRTVEENVVLYDIEQEDGNRINLSDLMLTRSTEVDQEFSVPLYPVVGSVIWSDDPVCEESISLYCYFDLFRNNLADTCHISLVLADQSNHIKYTNDLSVVGGQDRSAYFMPINCDRVASGKYNLLIQARLDTLEIERRISFRINSFGLPETIQDIDRAIQQLKYIASKREILLLSKQFPSERERSFIEYWDTHFSTPGQVVNRKMLEYYRRVHVANVQFGGIRSGWETDRGQVLIIYGQPTEVERSELDSQNVPYEVWNYHHINKRFVFRDDYGFGEYRLVTPIW